MASHRGYIEGQAEGQAEAHMTGADAFASTVAEGQESAHDISVQDSSAQRASSVQRTLPVPAGPPVRHGSAAEVQARPATTSPARRPLRTASPKSTATRRARVSSPMSPEEPSPRRSQ